MNDEIQLTLCNGDGNQIVIGAMDMATGIVENFCLPLHPQYEAWAEQMVAVGYVLCQMTIDDLMEAAGASNESIH